MDMRAHAKATVLFWSEDGEIGCVDHVPIAGSDRWTRERWSRMTGEMMRGARGYFDITESMPLCEGCRAAAARAGS